MDCVIFSSWVPQHLLHRGEQYLSYLLQYFENCDIFCGVNAGSSFQWLQMIEKYKNNGLHIQYSCVPQAMSSTSDNAGYQAGLQLYKNSSKNYDLVFFTHTKSITHAERNHREGVEHMVVSFHKNRQRYTQILHQDARYGGITAVGGINYEHLSLNKINEYYSFPCEALEQIYMLTNFVIKNEIIKKFVDGCNPEFFTIPFENKGYNRYFFEFYFPTIVSKMGYIPLTDEFWHRPTQTIAREEMKTNFEKWKMKSELTKDLTLPTTFEGIKP